MTATKTQSPARLAHPVEKISTTKIPTATETQEGRRLLETHHFVKIQHNYLFPSIIVRAVFLEACFPNYLSSLGRVSLYMTLEMFGREVVKMLAVVKSLR